MFNPNYFTEEKEVSECLGQLVSVYRVLEYTNGQFRIKAGNTDIRYYLIVPTQILTTLIENALLDGHSQATIETIQITNTVGATDYYKDSSSRDFVKATIMLQIGSKVEITWNSQILETLEYKEEYPE